MLKLSCCLYFLVANSIVLIEESNTRSSFNKVNFLLVLTSGGSVSVKFNRI